jgi:hypothetical protein
VESHVDYLGQPIKIGDYVVTAFGSPQSVIAIFKVVNAAKDRKQIKVIRLESKTEKVVAKYASDTIKVDPQMVTFKQLIK